jgi:hypothetical protein
LCCHNHAYDIFGQMGSDQQRSLRSAWPMDAANAG